MILLAGSSSAKPSSFSGYPARLGASQTLRSAKESAGPTLRLPAADAAWNPESAAKDNSVPIQHRGNLRLNHFPPFHPEVFEPRMNTDGHGSGALSGIGVPLLSVPLCVLCGKSFHRSRRDEESHTKARRHEAAGNLKTKAVLSADGADSALLWSNIGEICEICGSFGSQHHSPPPQPHVTHSMTDPDQPSSAASKKPMNISSQDWSPKVTVRVGSGLAGLAGELSKAPVTRSQAPAGTWRGSARR